MGIVDLLSNFRDIFEIGRKTTSHVESNKPKERNYNFKDEEKMPTTKLEYKKLKKANTPEKDNTPKKGEKNGEDLEL